VLEHRVDNVRGSRVVAKPLRDDPSSLVLKRDVSAVAGANPNGFHRFFHARVETIEALVVISVGPRGQECRLPVMARYNRVLSFGRQEETDKIESIFTISRDARQTNSRAADRRAGVKWFDHPGEVREGRRRRTSASP
jgi:hypothetical protein